MFSDDHFTVAPVNPTFPVPPTDSPVSSPNLQSYSPLSPTLQFYVVPWEKICSQGTIDDLEKGVGLEDHRLTLINSLSQHIFELDNHPSLKIINRISQNICQKYSTSFKAYLSHGGITSQIKNRMDQLNRKTSQEAKRKLAMVMPLGGLKKRGRPLKKERYVRELYVAEPHF